MAAFALCSTAALPVRSAVRSVAGKKASVSRVSQPTRTVATQALPVEVFTIANEASFIAGTAGTMISMTLIGLAIGFVLLRVESLVEEGKL